MRSLICPIGKVLLYFINGKQRNFKFVGWTCKARHRRRRKARRGNRYANAPLFQIQVLAQSSVVFFTRFACNFLWESMFIACFKCSYRRWNLLSQIVDPRCSHPGTENNAVTANFISSILCTGNFYLYFR